jgi:hypothetical protein
MTASTRNAARRRLQTQQQSRAALIEPWPFPAQAKIFIKILACDTEISG